MSSSSLNGELLSHEPDSPSLHSTLNQRIAEKGGPIKYTPAPVWLLLTLLVVVPVLTVNNFFAYHAPGAIGSSLQRYFGLDPEQFGHLFTLYSAPNIVLVFFGGVWIDRVGVITTSLLFNSFMLIGMILFALAPAEPELGEDGRTHASTRSMVILLGGRFLLGVGGECLCAASASMLAKWFRTSWLTMACGVNQALVQLLGSAAAFWLLPRIMVRGVQDANVDELDPATLKTNVDLCLWITVLVCGISLFANLIYVLIDWRFAARHMPPESEPTALEGSPDGSEYEPIRQVASIQSEEEQLLPTSSASSPADDITAWERVQSFTPLFWLVLTMHCLLSPILYTFTAFGPVALMERYGVDEIQAGSWTSLLYVAIVLSPVCGALIDAVGYRAYWQIGASTMIPILLAAMEFTYISPAFIMVAIGMAYAVTECNGLAMIAVAVPSSSLGTAYGLLGCGISGALLFEPYAVGALKLHTGRYDDANIMFMWITALGALCAVGVAIYDRTHDGTMTHRPIKQVTTDEQ